MFKRKYKIITLLINEDVCTGCGNCVVRCRRKVLNLMNDRNHTYAFISSSQNCKGCGHCLDVCDSGAIQLIRK